MVVHNDLPSNDFSSLFHLVQSHDRSYLHTRDNVSVLASGTSFYSRVMPRNSVHFGFSASAMHWLSRLPCKLSGAMNHLFLAHDSSEAQAFRSQALDDWRRILTHRAHEMVPGGVFMVVVSCLDENGKSPLQYGIGVMHQVAVRMQNEGILSEQEVQDLTIGHYLRSRGELTDRSLLQRCGLEVVRAEFKRPPNPIFQSYQRSGDAAEFAKSWVGYTQARMEPTVAAAFKDSTLSLASSGRAAPWTSRTKTELFFHRLEQHVLHDPAKHEYNGADRMLLCFRKQM